MKINDILPEGACNFHTRPRSPISHLYTPLMSTKRHTIISSLSPHNWILWVKVEFPHYNQLDKQMSINQ